MRHIVAKALYGRFGSYIRPDADNAVIMAINKIFHNESLLNDIIALVI